MHLFWQHSILSIHVLRIKAIAPVGHFDCLVENEYPPVINVGMRFFALVDYGLQSFLEKDDNVRHLFVQDVYALHVLLDVHLV